MFFPVMLFVTTYVSGAHARAAALGMLSRVWVCRPSVPPAFLFADGGLERNLQCSCGGLEVRD